MTNPLIEEAFREAATVLVYGCDSCQKYGDLFYKLGKALEATEIKMPNPTADIGARALRAMDSIADRLRQAGATLPAPEVTGTIEGSLVTGMCIALALVEQEIKQISASDVLGEESGSADR